MHPEDITRRCRMCGNPLTKRQTTFCSVRCLCVSNAKSGTRPVRSGAAHPGWKGGGAPIYYRKFLKGACERCGSTAFLVIHHRDRNRFNSDPSNLETLCKRCHQIEHRCWENLP